MLCVFFVISLFTAKDEHSLIKDGVKKREQYTGTFQNASE